MQNMNIVIFGDRPNDFSTISHAIEHSFDMYRKNLESVMENFSKFITKMNWIDEKYNNTFKSVHSEIEGFILHLPYYWETNEAVLRQLIRPWDFQLTYAIMPTALTPVVRQGTAKVNDEFAIRKDVPAYNSLAQVIIHLTRDWSSIGNNSRKSLYMETLIPLVEKYVLGSNSSPMILIPGSGLGRLGVELAVRGYRVELNECSASMICAMDTIINHLLPNQRTLTYHPFLHYMLMDDWDLMKRKTTTDFPYISDSDELSQFYRIKENPHLLSIQYGEFNQVYGESIDRRDSFDAIVTCFFIDTAANIFDYIDAIKNVLKGSGIWINAGPLHYHSANSLPYSLIHLLKIIEVAGFRILYQSKLNMTYCGEEEYSMKPELYNIPINVFQLID